MTKIERHLITTADERTWKFDRPVLFLGGWCRLYKRSSAWEGMDSEILPHHWVDHGVLYADYKYLRNVYGHMLPVLAERLNQIHGVEKELRYWRILIGPWLAYFIQIIFDRWSALRLATSQYKIASTTILPVNESLVIPNDMEQFCEMFEGDTWNHYIYRVILKEMSVAYDIRIESAEDFTVPARETLRQRNGIKKKMAILYEKLACTFVSDTDAFFIGTYLTRFEDLKLQIRLNQMPQMWQSQSPPRVQVDWQQRDWSLLVRTDCEFENILASLVAKQIPSIYLEGYQRLNEQISALPWPNEPKLVFSSNALLHDTVSMAYIAEKVTQGASLICGQHGGVYGVAKFTWAEEHEIAVSDRFLSWGWNDETQPKVKPVGMLKTSTIRRSLSNTKKTLLLVTLESLRYTYRLSSGTLAISNDYIANCFSFTEGLPGSVKRDLLVRLSLRDKGWGQVARWNDRFPAIKIDAGQLRMKDLLQDSRIAVFTYNSTGFLEAFAANIPSVLFWDTKVIGIRDAATPFYNELKQAGIFHETPEAAAAHIAAVWDDVDAWWNSLAVQRVLESFRSQYCSRPSDLLDRIIEEMNGAIYS